MRRCYYLDLAKVITTFLVIFGHLYSSDSEVRLHISAFHMPLFFIVSGVFHSYRGKIDWIHYCKTILWPVLIFMGLSITTGLLFHKVRFSFFWHHYFVELVSGKYSDILWFLFALFWCKVILDCVCRYSSFLFLWFFIWMGLLFVPVFIFKSRLPFALSQALMAFPFYVAGFRGKYFLLQKTVSFKWGFLFIGCLLLTVAITHLQGRVSMLGVKFGSIGNNVFGDNYMAFPSWIRGFLKIADVVLFYLNGFIGSFMILFFSLFPFPEIKIVTSLSKSLITVVGTQYLFINPIINAIGYNNGFLLTASITICIYIFCYLLHLLLRPVYQVIH